MLFYRLDVLHRGSPVLPGQVRYQLCPIPWAVPVAGPTETAEQKRETCVIKNIILQVRWTHHTNYRRKQCEWVGQSTWAKRLWMLEHSGLAGEGFSRAAYLAGLTELQRAALGVPVGAGRGAVRGGVAPRL